MELMHGERLHNPFNLEINKNIHWLGATDIAADPVFVTFMSDAFGLRAGFINLKNQILEGFDSIAKLVPHYAPAKDKNNVPAYIQALCKPLDKNPDDKLTIYDLKALGKAIITHEQGRLIYTDDELDTALRCAGVIASANVQPTNGNKPHTSFFSWLRKLLT